MLKTFIITSTPKPRLKAEKVSEYPSHINFFFVLDCEFLEVASGADNHHDAGFFFFCASRSGRGSIGLAGCAGGTEGALMRLSSPFLESRRRKISEKAEWLGPPLAPRPLITPIPPSLWARLNSPASLLLSSN